MTPLIYITLSFISGIILGSIFLYFPFSSSVFSAVLIILVLILTKETRIKSLILCLFFISGTFYYVISATRLPEGHISNFVGENAVVLKGRVPAPPSNSTDRKAFYLDVEGIYSSEKPSPASGRVKLSGNINSYIQYGDQILVRVKLKKPKGFHNPGGYDLEDALARDKVYTVGWIKDEDITVLGFKGYPFFRKIYDAREDIRKAIESSLGEESSYILQSMVIGEERGLSDEIRDAFMDSGTTHILSISGSHLGLLAFLIYNIIRLSILWLPSNLLLRLTLYTSPSKIAAFLTMPPVILYTIIAGGQVATIRSLIMILVYLFAILIEREDRLLNSLAFAAIIILLLNPQDLFDISFQLSYGSILSIGYVLDWWKGREKSPIEIEEKGIIPKAKKRLVQYFLVAAAATLGTAPLVAYYFNQFSWVGLFSNIIIIPLAGAVIVPLGLFSGFLTALSGSITLPLSSLIDKSVVIFYWIVKAFSKIPYAAIHLPSPPGLFIGFYYLFLYTILEWKRNKGMRIIGAGASLLIIILTIFFLLNKPGGMKVSFIDVGQGDSSLIELPDGKRMLIDGGKGPDKGFNAGRRVLAPYLWDKNIKRIDYLVLSHPHPDHMDGLGYIIKNFRINEIWVNGDESTEGYQEFRRLTEEKEIPVSVVKRGDAVFEGDYNIYILHPYPEFNPTSPRGEFSNQNNKSIVLKLLYKNRSFLFAGDIEKEAEENLIHLGKWLKADVIKVPHHGGKTSSTEEFLSIARPDIAVVSSGRDNIFHHPNPDVLERYEGMGTKVYRTDSDGAVIIESDGEKLKAETYRDLSLEKINLKERATVRSWLDMENKNRKKLSKTFLF